VRGKQRLLPCSLLSSLYNQVIEHNLAALVRPAFQFFAAPTGFIMRRSSIAVLLLLALLAQRSLVRAAEPLPAVIEFNRDIRPILSDNCFQCHGPDRARRKADLRLDTEAGAFADLGRTRALVPGDLGKSELLRRVAATNARERMPPAKSGRRLTERQIQLLRRWIEQGAKWQAHWSLLAPKRPPLPRSPLVPPARGGDKGGGPRNAIDFFILERLEREGLRPSPETDRITLLRRVTLDLTGLPPTPAEVDAFLTDDSPDAYEKMVDRLLASPRYGERMAVPWLNGTRYADTNGYQSDGERSMWRWRDWVIEAFNRNVPFDQFTIEQLAGDMLPGATLEQRIASGFNRNHRGNAEGGIIPEEYAVEYVVDRVDTTATVWLGLTLGCARCHDHKFDPITQKEFYQLFAYFNNVPEGGKAIKYGNSPPMIQAPTREQQEQLQKLQARLTAAEGRYRALQPRIATAQAEWEKSLPSTPPLDGSITEGMLAHFPLDGDKGNFDGRRFFDAGDAARFGYYDKFSFAAWVRPRGGQGGTLLSRMVDAPQAAGYSVVLENGQIHVNLVVRWLDDAIRVHAKQRLAADRACHVVVTYDGSHVASGIKVYLDGRPATLVVDLDDLNQNFKSKEPLRIGAGHGPSGRFHGAIQDVRIYGNVLSPEDAGILATTETINAIAAQPAGQRTPPQALKLRRYFLDHAAPPDIRQARAHFLALRRQRDRLIESFPTTMVMQEMPVPRDTFVLIRGEYDKHGEKVTPGVPASLPPLPAGTPNNRLGLARWLVDPANPLTARVTANRYWQMLFGIGLVKTVEDFGSQGEWPTHPELLDWLATEFVRTGWNVKAILRMIVTSATYRQSSKVKPDVLRRDPENRLLTRGPRFRLSAEMVRDQALFASSLLVEKIGGPSVKTYQPASLWKELADTEYYPDKGDNLYRRSLYTFWKRTVALPNMIAFDAAGRETCIVRQTRTNTPLQALTLMNDVTYMEASRVLAERVLRDRATPEQRLTRMFRLLTARPPRSMELKILCANLEKHLTRYRRDRQEALKLVAVGEAKHDEKLDVTELAAYTAVANLILNLDEAITRE
jgi:mono/diheme cytochrome c family protein